MFKKIPSHIHAVYDRDPSVKAGWFNTLLSCPSVHALIWHALTHWLWHAKLRGTARFLSNIARILTGIDIHPACTIGRGCFIDHGTGVVIGETAIIGNNVTLYQGVTLGGTNPAQHSAQQRNTKRHPTLCDGVIVGSGAQILGDITLGENCSVGANAVVVSDAPAGCVMIGIPAKPLPCSPEKRGAYGTIDGTCPDVPPHESLVKRIAELESQIKHLQHAITPPQNQTKGEQG